MEIYYLPTWANVIFVIAVVWLLVLWLKPKVVTLLKNKANQSEENDSKVKFLQNLNLELYYDIFAISASFVLAIYLLISDCDLSKIGIDYHMVFSVISLIALAAFGIAYGEYAEARSEESIKQAKISLLVVLLSYLFFIIVSTLLFCNLKCAILWFIGTMILIIVKVLLSIFKK